MPAECGGGQTVAMVPYCAPAQMYNQVHAFIKYMYVLSAVNALGNFNCIRAVHALEHCIVSL